MREQIKPGLAGAQPETVDFEMALQDYESASNMVSMFRGQIIDLGDLFNEATDILCEVMALRKKFCETGDGNEMKYVSPTDNEFEVVIKGLNAIRCQFSDFMSEAKANQESAEKKRNERERELKTMAGIKSELP